MASINDGIANALSEGKSPQEILDFLKSSEDPQHKDWYSNYSANMQSRNAESNASPAPATGLLPWIEENPKTAAAIPISMYAAKQGINLANTISERKTAAANTALNERRTAAYENQVAKQGVTSFEEGQPAGTIASDPLVEHKIRAAKAQADMAEFKLAQAQAKAQPTAPTQVAPPQVTFPVQPPVDLNAKIEAAKQANAARAVENAPINRGTEQPVSQWADEVPKTPAAPAVPPTAPAAAIAPPAPPTPPTPTTPSDPRAAFLQKAQEIQGQAVVPPAGGARRNPAQLAEFKVEEPLNKGVNQLVYSAGANKPNVPETEFRDFRNAAIDEVYGGQPPASQGGSVKNQKQLTNWIETNKERFPNVWNNYQAIKDKFPTQGGSASLGMLLNLVGLSGLAVEGVKASKSGDWSNFGLGAVNQAVSNIAPRASMPTALMTYSKSAGETPEELKALGERLKYAQKVGYGRGSQGVPPP